jgi:hypothetical protein
MDIKELINPFILIPLIILANYTIGFSGFNLMISSFIVFFSFSFLNNLWLVLRKKVNHHFYLFVYIELFFSLVFLIPLFYFINLKHYILISLFVISLVDAGIQVCYNLFPNKIEKKIAKLWENKLIKSEKGMFHPISMQKYVFKDFICEIIEVKHINPLINYVNHSNFLRLRINKNLVRYEYSNKKAIAFQIYLKNKMQSNRQYDREVTTDKIIMDKIKRIGKKIYPQIVTAYLKQNDMLRLVLRKEFIFKNPDKTYYFLAKLAKTLK